MIKFISELMVRILLNNGLENKTKNELEIYQYGFEMILSTATLGIGSFSVSANELTTAEDKFIASYKNADEIKAANYYLSNGLSVEEAQELMNIYIDGKAKLEANNNPKSRAIPTGGNFYSTTNLSSNPHYGVVIANDSKCGDIYAKAKNLQEVLCRIYEFI